MCECDNQSRCTDDSCFNRMLYIECYASLCPCGTKCANRRFQTGRSVRTEKFDAGKKGWGLRPLDQIPSGAFIGEYVGEVISPDMVADRKIEYKEKGHTHHFFMNLSPTEIIDATAMGSITRFINHSCEPNCELQKWTVNGEFRLGFFTTRPVDALEEVTFDYQYERGDIEQECFCGSEMCRGLITAATKADRKASGGGSGKRRRLDPAVKAERDLEALRKRLRKLTGTGGAVGYAAESEEIGGVGKVKSILDLLRMMIQNDGGDDQKMEFLAVLQNTEAEACLDQFLKIRGLRTLSNWLAALTTPEAKYAMMKVLDHLTIATTNVVDTSGIRPALESISSLENPSEGDEELPTLARNLLAKWSTLRTVYVLFCSPFFFFFFFSDGVGRVKLRILHAPLQHPLVITADASFDTDLQCCACLLVLKVRDCKGGHWNGHQRNCHPTQPFERVSNNYTSQLISYVRWCHWRSVEG